MIAQNIIFLRKSRQWTQEELAELVGVSRQAVAKWETGETLPDLRSCCAMAEAFGVTLDNLVHYDPAETGIPIPPKGKHLFGTVTVGERGQVSIPKRAREIFHIQFWFAGHTCFFPNGYVTCLFSKRKTNYKDFRCNFKGNLFVKGLLSFFYSGNNTFRFFQRD